MGIEAVQSYYGIQTSQHACNRCQSNWYPGKKNVIIILLTYKSYLLGNNCQCRAKFRKLQTTVHILYVCQVFENMNCTNDHEMREQNRHPFSVTGASACCFVCRCCHGSRAGTGISRGGGDSLQLGREHPPLLHPPLQGHALVCDPVTTKLSRLIPPRKKRKSWGRQSLRGHN